ncbi:MAG TPA: hypothetical protein P5149_15450 [Candidatus Competibacteraceae bacterium]|nr:hypothetical protein [Candidatus Competibacteraceae bacterium]HPF57340.1 hypothetical protein [Candidatus Competibacteraceae bacterium]HRY19782.1 hypothetical protein [Candidatus Competibacteraceae bacterium]
MYYPNLATAQQQTQAAIEAMRAYFAATSQARPRKERQQLANEWLNAIRQMRAISTTQ